MAGLRRQTSADALLWMSAEFKLNAILSLMQHTFFKIGVFGVVSFESFLQKNDNPKRTNLQIISMCACSFKDGIA